MSFLTPWVGYIPFFPSMSTRGEKRVRKALQRIRCDADLVLFVRGTAGWELVPGNIRDEGDKEWIVPVDEDEAPYPADGIPDTPPMLFGCPIGIAYRHWGCLNEVPNVVLDMTEGSEESASNDWDPEEAALELETVVETHSDAGSRPGDMLEDASEILNAETPAVTDGGEESEDNDDSLFATFDAADRLGLDSDDNSDEESPDTAEDVDADLDVNPEDDELRDSGTKNPSTRDEKAENRQTLRERLLSPIAWTRGWLGRRREGWRQYQFRKGWRWLNGDATTLILQQDDDAEMYTDPADYSQPDQDEANWAGYITQLNQHRYDGRGAGGSPVRVSGTNTTLGLAYAPVAKLLSPVACRAGRNLHATRLSDGEDEPGRYNDICIEERASIWPADVVLLGGEHVSQEKIERAIEQARAKSNPPGGQFADKAMKLGGIILALILGVTLGDPSFIVEAAQQVLSTGVVG